MGSYFRRAFVSVVVLMTLASMAMADDLPENPSSVDAMSIFGSDGSIQNSLDLDLAIDPKSSFTIGGTRVHTPVTATQPDNLDTRELRAGYDYSPDDSFSESFQYTLWGEAGRISTNAVAAGFRWISDDWTCSIAPGLRLISLNYVRRTTGRAAKDNFFDPTLSANIKYKALYPWSFKLLADYYFYNKDMSVLAQTDATRYFSASALTLANSFQKYDAGGEIAYQFKVVKLALNYVYAISEIDNSASNIYTFKSSWELGTHWEVEGDVGQSPPATGDTTTITTYGAGLTYNW